MPAYGLGPYGLDIYGTDKLVYDIPPGHAGPAPLSVVLDTLDGPRNITRDVSNLTIKNTSPGGFASVTFDLKRRIDEARLPLGAQVRVYNTTTGEQVGGGRLIEQGISSDGAWNVSCLGEAIAALQDVEEPYMVIDTNPESTSRPIPVGVKVKQAPKVSRKRPKKNARSIPGVRRRGYKQITGFVFSEVKPGTAPDGSTTEGLLFQFPPGATIATNANVAAQFRGVHLCGMHLGAYTYRHRAGLSASTWKMTARTITASNATSEIDRDNDWQTSLAPHSWAAAGPTFDEGRDVLELDARYVGSGGTTGQLAWAHVQNLIIRSRLYGADGTYRPGVDHCLATVKAGEVFTDLIVRRCPSLKVGTVVTGAHSFTQLAWYEGVSAKTVLDEVADTDGTVTYHAWEVDPDGRTPIHLETLPSMVRYELTPEYGYSAPSSTVDVYTRVVIVGVDDSGYERRYVQDRTPAGQPARSQTIDLEEEFTDARAEQVADLFLDNHAAAPNAGTVTVARPVLDLWTGRYVDPSAIRSSHLCRLRGVQPNPNSLNPDARQDGVTIFRIVSSTYSDESGTASLELDSPVFDQERAIADLIAG